jgi:hypothetical protein
MLTESVIPDGWIVAEVEGLDPSWQNWNDVEVGDFIEGMTHAQVAIEAFDLQHIEYELGDLDLSEAVAVALDNGWIRVTSGMFQMQVFDDLAKRLISEFLKDYRHDGEVTIEVLHHPKMYADVEVEDIIDQGITAAQFAAKYTRRQF